ncbi:MAG: hypothetical protein ABH879_04205 [archaeon]
MQEKNDQITQLAKTLKSSGLAASMVEAMEKAQSIIGVSNKTLEGGPADNAAGDQEQQAEQESMSETAADKPEASPLPVPDGEYEAVSEEAAEKGTPDSGITPGAADAQLKGAAEEARDGADLPAPGKIEMAASQPANNGHQKEDDGQVLYEDISLRELMEEDATHIYGSDDSETYSGESPDVDMVKTEDELREDGRITDEELSRESIPQPEDSVRVPAPACENIPEKKERRATLTKEEKEMTDLTKLFNYGNK